MKKLVKTKCGFAVVITAVALVLALLVTYALPILLTMQSGVASCRMTMSFDGIAQGKDPKGNPVNIYEMQSDSVLKRALEIADLSSRYTVEELRDMVTVNMAASDSALGLLTGIQEPSTDKTTGVEENLSPIGVYVITVRDHGMVSRARSIKLLNALVEAYREQFKIRYLQSVSANPGYSLEEILTLDYPEMMDAIESEANQVVRYADSFVAASPNYVSASGLSFADISSQAQAVYSTDMNTYRGMVDYYMLTNDRVERLQYEYRRFDRYEFQFAKLNARSDAISKIANAYDNSTNYVITSGTTAPVDTAQDNTFYGDLLNTLIAAKNTAADVRYAYEKTRENITKLSTEGIPADTYSSMSESVKAGVKTAYEKLSTIRKQISVMAEEDYEQNVEAKIKISQSGYHLTANGSIVTNFIGMLMLCILCVIGFRVWKKRHAQKKKV